MADNWPDCQKIVAGVSGAKFKAFLTLKEAERWLAAGADYSIKHIAAKKGIYFDAGTGAGRGVEINVTDEKGRGLLDKIALKNVTNNFGELLACKYALQIAEKEGIKKIFGDSKLIIESWSNGFLNKKGLPIETVRLVKEVKELRDEFERAGGKIGFIPGASNPADLGFHRE